MSFTLEETFAIALRSLERNLSNVHLNPKPEKAGEKSESAPKLKGFLKKTSQFDKPKSHIDEEPIQDGESNEEPYIVEFDSETSYKILVKERGQIDFFHHYKVISECGLYTSYSELSRGGTCGCKSCTNLFGNKDWKALFERVKDAHDWLKEVEEEHQGANTVHYVIARLENMADNKTLLRSQNCGFCKDSPYCPLQPRTRETAHLGATTLDERPHGECRHCDDPSDCPLQPHNITVEETPHMPERERTQMSKYIYRAQEEVGVYDDEVAHVNRYFDDRQLENEWRYSQTPIGD